MYTDLENIHYHGINALEYMNMLEDLEFYSLIKKLDIDKDMLEQNRKVECHHEELKVEILEDLTDFKFERSITSSSFIVNVLFP